MSELLPCPFCGSPAKEAGFESAKCSDKTEKCPLWLIPIHWKAWNTRPQVTGKDGWQDIETALKDGTRILGWHQETGCQVFFWTGYGWGYPGFVPKEQPTHWQPLPAPPQESEKP